MLIYPLVREAREARRMNTQEAAMFNNYMDHAERNIRALAEAFTVIGDIKRAKANQKAYEEVKFHFDFIRQMIDDLTTED